MPNESAPKRKYELKKRARSMRETQSRIARATFELHGILGPARTTISAVAERAGVERATVYRHYPDDLSLFRACVGHGLEANPPPDPSDWAGIPDPEKRLRRGLSELYSYYRRMEWVLTKVVRDLPEMPDLQRANAELGFFDWLRSVGETLARGWTVRGRSRRLLRAAVSHVTDYQTWLSLAVRHELTDADTVEVAVRTIRCLAA